MKEPIFILDGFEALSTKWYLEVFENVNENTQASLKKELECFLLDFQNRYSRFNKDSFLNEFNQKRSIQYDEALLSMLRIGEKLYKETSGIFNLFIKDELEEKGYGQRNTTSYSDHSEAQGFAVNDDTISLFGSKTIDLGGIGKGYLIDRVARLLKEKYHIEQFLINGGGDMYGTHYDGKSISVYLQHPLKREVLIGEITIFNQAFCSSSSYIRLWQKDGVTKNHFVSKDKSEVWAASFVVGSTATITDCFATIFCLTSNDIDLTKDLADKFSLEYLVYDESFQSFGNLAYTKE